ncbi:outer membrane protein assembly factor BamB [Pseudomarimonas arenosa]|uniref:Outer membrane protein assembly factor BamB n=1 Tax=Pseudomarimonas arenosa TaxID=2774145 RepID=A0AAW3ZLK5_9GAMM|nr:outer membrane protein assembly factor BamB [Pseudomarimonas arenosa]MBD8525296.1 outer membrane protein assembly factor BamB [Pseudomarimonas arenosa]
MPKARLSHAIVLALTVSLVGCSAFKGKTNKENIEPPIELTDIANEIPVSTAWSRSIGDGERKLGLRQPVAALGDAVYAGGPDGRLLALNRSGGKALWEIKGEDRYAGGPAVGEGTLVVGTLDGQVIAYNPDNGSERWRAKVSSEVISVPAIGRGLAVVRCNDGRVFAFSITDGTRRWVYDRGLPSLTLRGNSRPVIEGDRVFLGYDSGVVVALKLLDGAQLWEQTVAEGEGRHELDRMVDIDGEIVASGSEVYAAAFNGQVVALDAGSGRPLWNREMSVFSGLALAGDKILVSDKAATVWALDRRTGASLWRQDGLAHRWLTTPVVSGTRLAVGDLEGYLHVLDVESGMIVGRDQVGGDPIRATPQLADDLVLAVTIDGDLAAYRIGP